MSSLFLLLSLLPLSLVSGQPCQATRDINPATQTQSYDAHYASLNPPLCDVLDDALQQYADAYTVLSSSSNLSSTDCAGGAQNLFDGSSLTSWVASSSKKGENPYVIFQTDFVLPVAVGIWNAGDGIHDIRESTLESATNPKGPWTLVLTMTSVDFYAVNEPQAYPINTTRHWKWRQYWRWTIKSTFNKTVTATVRELQFFTRPHALTGYPGNPYVSPAPFYTLNRTVVNPSLPPPPPGSYASSTASPFGYVFVVPINLVDNYEVAGVIFSATSVANGVTDMSLRLWDADNQTKLCEFRSPTGHPVTEGLCGFAPAYLQLFTFAFVADQKCSPPRPNRPSPVHISGLDFLTCPSWKCYSGFTTVNFVSPSSGARENVTVIEIHINDSCEKGQGASTAILF